MITHFCELAAHRNYVLALYRHSLRNVSRINSGFVKHKMKKVITNEARKHKNDKSSWSIYRRLKELKLLSDKLEDDQVNDAYNLLDSFMKSVKKPKNELKGHLMKIRTEIETNKNIQDKTRLTRLNLLHRYIAKKQQNQLLTKHIPDEYKEKLLLPLALHEKGILRLAAIRNQFKKGGYHAKLSFTMAGKTRIWFIRSMLNKRKKQSLRLRNLITSEKRRYLEVCKIVESLNENANWALYEAIWERYLDDGYLHATSSKGYLKMVEIEDNSVKLQNQNDSKVVKCQRLQQWLSPIQSSILSLENSLNQRQMKYAKLKTKILEPKGVYDYYQKKTKRVFQNHMKTYKRMVKNELPFVNPFIERLSIGSILKRNGINVKY
ncbi:PP-loop family [Nakaseomyces glabratus]|nr:PP-loop family [Nakaseomyces glabratus]KAH7602336.1 PP-loop family [Nakaseomyces glabratus]KAH7613726.1 PP-loop family [Nakaseomyces glabratus]